MRLKQPLSLFHSGTELGLGILSSLQVNPALEGNRDCGAELSGIGEDHTTKQTAQKSPGGRRFFSSLSLLGPCPGLPVSTFLFRTLSPSLLWSQVCPALGPNLPASLGKRNTCESQVLTMRSWTSGTGVTCEC